MLEFDDLGELVESIINEWMGRNVATAYASDSVLKSGTQKPVLEIIIENDDRKIVGKVSVVTSTKIAVLSDGTIAQFTSETKPTGEVTFTGSENIAVMQTTLSLTSTHDEGCERIPRLLKEFEQTGSTSLDLDSIAAEIADAAIEIHNK